MRNPLTHWSPQRLRIAVTGFFVALAIPTAILIYQAYDQLKWEAFHHHRQLAEELVQRVDRQLEEFIATEDARKYSDYAFLNVTGNVAQNFLQRSPLSTYPVRSAIPGLIGYFQIDANGRFTTPLLPDNDNKNSALGIPVAEWQARKALARQIYQILGQNRLASMPAERKERSARLNKKDREADRTMEDAASTLPKSPPAPLPSVSSPSLSSRLEPDKETTYPPEEEAYAGASVKSFDELQSKKGQIKVPSKLSKGLGRVDELQLAQPYADEAGKDRKKARKESPAMKNESEKRAMRQEQALTPETGRNENKPGTRRKLKQSNIPVRMFQSEIDPVEFSLLESGHFVIYRKVWRDNQKLIQGALIEPDTFFPGIFAGSFQQSTLSRNSKLAIAWQGQVLAAYGDVTSRAYLTSSQDLAGALLYQSRLSAPLDQIEMIFSIQSLPAGPGSVVVSWIAAVLILIMCTGFYLLYKLALKQVTLAHQQQDFVSAISHELKTPLTSIRMYGEMLKEGWVEEKKRKSYYNFIYDESERLSRLISNVLQLARMTRNELDIELQPHKITELVDHIRSKTGSQCEAAGYNLEIHCNESAELVVHADMDIFSQIFINLVDNAIKFSKKSDRHQVDISCSRQGKDHIVFSVRDYGPGIARDQMKKIFQLFFRSENELTRETVGTGIGLSLVSQLVQAMHGKIDIVNRDPGAEFRITFPLKTDH